MTRNLKRCLLIASMALLAWTTTSEACHRQRGYTSGGYYYSGYNNQGYAYRQPTAYSGGGGSYYSNAGSGYYSNAGSGYYSNPGGYYGGRAYNPGGLGGPR